MRLLEHGAHAAHAWALGAVQRRAVRDEARELKRGVGRQAREVERRAGAHEGEARGRRIGHAAHRGPGLQARHDLRWRSLFGAGGKGRRAA